MYYYNIITIKFSIANIDIDQLQNRPNKFYIKTQVINNKYIDVYYII